MGLCVNAELINSRRQRSGSVYEVLGAIQCALTLRAGTSEATLQTTLDDEQPEGSGHCCD